MGHVRFTNDSVDRVILDGSSFGASQPLLRPSNIREIYHFGGRGILVRRGIMFDGCTYTSEYPWREFCELIAVQRWGSLTLWEVFQEAVRDYFTFMMTIRGHTQLIMWMNFWRKSLFTEWSGQPDHWITIPQNMFGMIWKEPLHDISPSPWV
ncbi:hypothetical protein AVEN_118401-1 [Araneus ventricosus]|uniref:Uncharacterized protein n=1 Tax=Araneus ventricosus TaxID=182803 RepID=A0A4Y2B623_ARAVE|nr:hypothetical protein AVEN_118401-1 [Araneus ventricosus]